MSITPKPRWRILVRSDISQLETRAGELLNGYVAGEPDATGFFTDFHQAVPTQEDASLADAHLVIAIAHDFPSWPCISRERVGQ